MPVVGKTAYSSLFGGIRGYPNEGPWNTTLTDVSLTAQEAVGIIRVEGANRYRYVQFGTNGAAAGAFLVTTTALTDVNGLLPPMAFTAGGTAATGYVARGMAVAAVATGGGYYGWMLVEGIASGTVHVNSGITAGAMACPSTNSANVLEPVCTPTTAVARALETIGSGAAGLFYYTFKL